MKQSACMLALSFALVGGLGASVAAFASEPLTCSLSVSPLKADSSVKKSGGGNKGRGSSSTTTTQNGGRNSRGGGGTKSETTGERVTGCVIQVFAGGQLMKSWASDSRWAKAAKNPSFAIELIDPKSGAKKK